jgi:hypothetical protein
MARDRELREVFNNDMDGKDYVELFDGKMIRIPARGSVIMERTECVRFLGSFRGFDKEISSGAKPLAWKPAKPGAKETVFQIQGETPVATPQRAKPSVESADPIKELEHLSA